MEKEKQLDTRNTLHRVLLYVFPVLVAELHASDSAKANSNAEETGPGYGDDETNERDAQGFAGQHERLCDGSGSRCLCNSICASG